MRVVLIGNEGEVRRLRTGIENTPEIVGEFPTLADARRAGAGADAYVLANRADAEPRDEIAPETLTRRELEVLELVAEGLSNRAIAERLAISDQTVKFHLTSISGKLGAANRTDAVRRAVRRGLVTL